MITAKEALELYRESGEEVKNYIEYNIARKVEEAAKSGKITWTLHLGAVTEGYDLPKTNRVMDLVIKKVSDLGYLVRYAKYDEPYFRNGLGSFKEAGDRRLENYGLIISWGCAS